MPAATSPVTFTTAVVAAAGTSVAPAVALPWNCYRVVIVNNGAGTGLWTVGAAGGALALGSSAGIIPPMGLREIDCGDAVRRGSGFSLAIDVPAGTPVPYTFYIEYHNSLTGLGGHAP